jgi:hypothetical protein
LSSAAFDIILKIEKNLCKINMHAFFAACKQGDAATVQRIMRTQRPHEPDANTGYTLAILYQQRAVVAVLESYNVDRTLGFLYACALGEPTTVDRFLYTITDNEDLTRGIDYAVECGHTQLILLFLARNRATPDSILARACRYDQVVIAAAMVEYGARNFEYAMDHAISYNKPRMITLIKKFQVRYPQPVTGVLCTPAVFKLIDHTT